MVWEDSFYKSDNTVMVHITKIREKIEENPRQPVYLKQYGELAIEYDRSYEIKG